MDGRQRVPGGEGSPRALCDRDPSLAQRIDADGIVRGPRVELNQRARPSVALTGPDCDAVIDAMCVAAEKRLEGILGNSRRQHYGHAALLVASCVAYAPGKRAVPLLRWAMDLRQQYRRRHAFRAELARAFQSLGVPVPS
jgi:hypothetical protein